MTSPLPRVGSPGVPPIPHAPQGLSPSEAECQHSRLIHYQSKCRYLRDERDHALREYASNAGVVAVLEGVLASWGTDPSLIIERALVRHPLPPPLERTQSLAISRCSLRVGDRGSLQVENTSRLGADDHEAASSHRPSRSRHSHSPAF
ncbi:hypothetical protein AMTRI_Chr04g183230 [Amborella trichopoda]|uniref:Uncharacterized protein n=1 Tax=Amborella trichopoda TaxID=13333 RepID=W1NIP4_AMBTC|nr:hypothetical protein AMTR_s00008p00207450 [Amborella trichopoda]